MAMIGPVAAQPKVTITGLVDNITSYTHNMSQIDFNPARNSENEWYARTRVRPDIIAEVGTTKFVLGLEIDSTWGQTAGQDTSVCLSAACPNTPQRFGVTSGWDLNTDVQGSIEVKWAYTEFDVPIVPLKTRMRLGAQPFQTQYKPATLATGDFAGVNLTTQILPNLKGNFTYASIEEANTGPKDGFVRGDDFAIFASVEITPFKGLDIRPIFSYANLIGNTGAVVRQNRGGLPVGTATFPLCPGTAGPGTGACTTVRSSAKEDRYTIGVDARWRFGAFYLDPTIFYQFGTRDQIGATSSTTSGPRVMTELKRDAIFVDMRGGWQAGPLLLEIAGVYTTGNKAEDRIDLGRSRLKFFEPIDTDGSYFAGWCETHCGGAVDYFNTFRATTAAVRPTIAIGYDKYGLIIGALRASYALTPAFTLRSAFHARWAAEDVDTAGIFVPASGITPRCPAAALDNGTCTDDGTANYLGSEVSVGFQWRFAPNVALDFAAAYFFSGNALSQHLIQSGTGVRQSGRDPADMQTVSTRVRYTW
jgi:hypothetical protein